MPRLPIVHATRVAICAESTIFIYNPKIWIQAFRWKRYNPNREVSWVQMRNFLEHDFDDRGDYSSTGIIIYYELTLTIVNYNVTRING